LLFHNKPGF